MSRQILVYRPGHPKASKFGNVDIRELSPEEARLAVEGPRHVNIVGDMHHDGVVSPVDGSLIDSKVKRREHMKRHGLADFDDFKDVHAKKAAEREQMRTGHFQTKERKEAIEKAFWQVTEKGYKPEAPNTEIQGRVGDTAAVVVSDDVIPDADKGVVRLKENE